MIKYHGKTGIAHILALSFLFLQQKTSAQEAFMIGQQRYIQISPIFQTWEDDQQTGLSEISTMAMFYFPLNDRLGCSLVTGQASVTSDVSPKLTGLIDTQVNLNYYLRQISTLFSLGVNLPTGKKMLTANEFTTSYFISLNQYNFRVPNFGQGFNLSPGVSWAIALSETFVLGLGLSVQYRGPFTPFESMTGQYDPGEEFLVTGGMDVRLSETTTFSTDLVYTTYGKDLLDGEETYKAGNKFVTHVQLKINKGYNEFRLFCRYRSKDKNQIAIAGTFLPDEQKTIPNQFDIMARYRFRMGQRHYGALIGELKFFDETSVWNKTKILAFGLNPEFSLSPNVKMPVQLKYSICDIENGSKLTGFEFGLGLYFSF